MKSPRRAPQTAPASLADWGEDRLVAALTQGLPLDAQVLVGAGDDCAVIGRPRDQRWQLLKTDAVVEGVHFLAAEDPQRVGWKALCRAISDIAAMGGTPAHALITLAAPATTPVARVQALYAGLCKAARKYGVAIAGGETSRSPGPLFLSIALTGWVERKHCVLRSGGRPGDYLYVTGRLGGSLAGKHLDFHPRLDEARWLVSHFKPRAMMDLSDGLAADLPRLAAASRCSHVIQEDRIPLNPGCTTAQAMADGEDFELLFALAPRSATALEAAWKKRFPRLPLTRIGHLLHPSSFTLHPSPRGYDHFAQR
ncbi:MAG: thiamine-phosphate kinase [Chthoniobacter sp.]|uniref:thiamine-phosphate kinase n=1 Tax=Chthoniobacter sp. TaxID=2510640 RepID=UPI0032ADB1F1